MTGRPSRGRAFLRHTGLPAPPADAPFSGHPRSAPCSRTPLQKTLPLIPTAVVGSHGKPGWWFASVKAVALGEFGPGDLEEMFDDAANTAIRDMETAGIDII